MDKDNPQRSETLPFEIPPVWSRWPHWQAMLEERLKRIWLKGQSIESIEQNIWLARRMASWFGKSPGVLKKSHIQEFLGANLAPSTYNTYLMLLDGIYKDASRHKIPYRSKEKPLIQLSKRPTADLKLLKTYPSPKYFSEEEINTFFRAFPNTLFGLQKRAFFLTLFWTARRRAEIWSLKWGDIEQGIRFDDGKVGVAYHWIGKGRRRLRDTAELPRPAWNAILQYLEAAGKVRLDVQGRLIESRMQSDESLWIAICNGSMTDRRIALNATGRWMRESLKAAGLSDKGFSTHCLRHTAARFRYKRGASVEEIRRLLRHANIQTTMLYLMSLDLLSDERARLMEAEFAGL